MYSIGSRPSTGSSKYAYDYSDLGAELGLCGVVIVTGAAQGIGRATAVHFAQKHKDLAVVLAIRQPMNDPDRAARIASKLRVVTYHPGIYGLHVDLSNFDSVQTFRDDVDRMGLPVVAIVNAAGECPERRETRHNGIEAQFASNVLGYHFMIRAFYEMLIGSKGRVVNVASDWAGDLKLDDLEFKKRPYDNDLAYRQAKQCNRMLTVTWAEDLAQYGVLVNACHPGDPNTTLSRALGYNGNASKDCSHCNAPYMLATRTDITVTGAWFDKECNQIQDRFAAPTLASQRKRLWNICEQHCSDAMASTSSTVSPLRRFSFSKIAKKKAKKEDSLQSGFSGSSSRSR